jgi:hypothetical protein
MTQDPFELLELLEKQIMQHIQITSVQMTQDQFEHLELLEKQIRYAAHPDQINVMTEDPFELLRLLENQVFISAWCNLRLQMGNSRLP